MPPKGAWNSVNVPDQIVDSVKDFVGASSSVVNILNMMTQMKQSIRRIAEVTLGVDMDGPYGYVYVSQNGIYPLTISDKPELVGSTLHINMGVDFNKNKPWIKPTWIMINGGLERYDPATNGITMIKNVGGSEDGQTE